VINDDEFKLPNHYLECTKSQTNSAKKVLNFDTVDIEELDFLRFKV